ncbi:hypothetical protein, partial [Ensifer aridi]|uniref:hypothetical protein n=1 Tax=Ensifer aridi TaxID=1708715 RepID=UPI001969D061
FARPSSTQSPSDKKTESVLQDCFKPDFFNTISASRPFGLTTADDRSPPIVVVGVRRTEWLDLVRVADDSD